MNSSAHARCRAAADGMVYEGRSWAARIFLQAFVVPMARLLRMRLNAVVNKQTPFNQSNHETIPFTKFMSEALWSRCLPRRRAPRRRAFDLCTSGNWQCGENRETRKRECGTTPAARRFGRSESRRCGEYAHECSPVPDQINNK